MFDDGYFRSGSANIVRACKQRLAAVWVWVTALLLLAQPCAGMHCSCRQVAQRETSCASEGCGHHCQHSCSHTTVKYRRVCAVASSLPLESLHSASPCGCPANCPCRVHHAQQQFGLMRSASYERLDDATQLPVVCVRPPSNQHADEIPTRLRTQPKLLTSNQCCALLCRFTI